MIALRPADGEQDFRTIFAILLMQFSEVGRAALNYEKAGQYIYRVMSEGAAYIIEKDGQPIGSIGLSILSYWYSDSCFWSEEWLYVVPHERNGAALRAVFSEMKTLGEETNLPVQVTIFNAKRARSSTEIHRDAERFFFTPGGVSATLNSKAED